MARTFNGTSDKIATTVSTPMNAGFGTFVAILRPTTIAATISWARFCSSAFANLLGAFIDATGKVGYSNAAAAPVGATSLVVNNWYCIAVGKATGTTTPRVHIYRYSTNAFVHENTGSSIADATAPTTAGFLNVGSRVSDQFFPGDIAVCGFWNRNLSDAEFELLPFTLDGWFALVPSILLVLDQADAVQGTPDLSGNGAVATITGTIVSSNSVPVFSVGIDVWMITRAQAGGATLYLLSVGGAITPSGAALHQSMKLAGGTLTSAGVLVKTSSKLLSATFASAGVLVKVSSKLLSAVLSTVGAATKGTQHVASGVLVTNGTQIKSIGRALSAVLSTAGAVLKGTQHVAGGALATSGAHIKSTSRTLGGVLGIAGVVTKVQQYVMSLGGTLGTIGGAAKITARLIDGSLVGAGQILRGVTHSVGGAIGTSGTTYKSTTATIGGALGVSGGVSTVRTIMVLVGGVLGFSGAVVKVGAKAVGGTLGVLGGPSKNVARFVGGNLGTGGILERGFSRNLIGVLSLVGTLVRQVFGATPLGTATATVSRYQAPTATVQDYNKAVSVITAPYEQATSEVERS